MYAYELVVDKSLLQSLEIYKLLSLGKSSTHKAEDVVKNKKSFITLS